MSLNYFEKQAYELLSKRAGQQPSPPPAVAGNRTQQAGAGAPPSVSAAYKPSGGDSPAAKCLSAINGIRGRLQFNSAPAAPVAATGEMPPQPANMHAAWIDDEDMKRKAKIKTAGLLKLATQQRQAQQQRRGQPQQPSITRHIQNTFGVDSNAQPVQRQQKPQQQPQQKPSFTSRVVGKVMPYYAKAKAFVKNPNGMVDKWLSDRMYGAFNQTKERIYKDHPGLNAFGNNGGEVIDNVLGAGKWVKDNYGKVLAGAGTLMVGAPMLGSYMGASMGQPQQQTGYQQTPDQAEDAAIQQLMDRRNDQFRSR